MTSTGSSARGREAAQGWTVRPARVTDAASLAAVGREVFLQTYTHTTEENVRAYLDAAYTAEAMSSTIGDPTRRTLVAAKSDCPGIDAGATTPGGGDVGGTESIVGGFATLVLDSSGSLPLLQPFPRPIELQRIYVSSAYHGSGLGRLILDGVYDLARAEGYESIWLCVLPTNTRAVRFYEKCGFEKIGSKTFWLGQQRDEDDVMIKQL